MNTLMAKETLYDLRLRIWKSLTTNLQSVAGNFIPDPGFFRGLKIGFIPLVIVANFVFLGYTYYVVTNLRQDTQENVAKFAFFYRIATSDTYTVKGFGEDVKVVLNSLSKSQIPMVITDEDGEPLLWRNINIPSNDRSPAHLISAKEAVHQFDLQNPPYVFEIPPSVVGISSDNTPKKMMLHFGEPRIETQIFWWYVITFSMIVLLLAVAYVGYQNARKVEVHPETKDKI